MHRESIDFYSWFLTHLDVHRHFHSVLALLRVQNQVEAASADPRQLAQHDVLRHPLEVIALPVGGGLHEHVHRLLEGALHQGAHLLPVDAVTRDGHQVAFRGHDVAEEG